MKKERVIPIGILFATLCLVVTACTQGLDAGKGTGTVQVVIGGGAVRSVGANGLPEFDDTNTKIIVTDEAGAQLAQGTTSVTLSVDIGKKITVEATITTAAGVWRGSTKHTVTKGANTVAVKLSKAAKTMRNILINSTGRAAALKLESGEELLENIPIDHSVPHDVHPVIARDSIGRIYVLYRNKHSVAQTTHLRRIDVEGNGGTETGFHDKISEALPPSTIDTITNMAIDVKHNYIFLFRGMTVYCLKEKEDHSFEYIVQGSFPIPAATPLNVTAAAVYDDVLFVVDGTTLYACKFEIEDLPGHGHLGRKRLQFKPVGGSDAASLNLPKLRTDSAFSNNLTKCTGLFADESGVYCLLSENSIAWNRYMVGSVVQCVYKNDGSLEQKGEPKGLNPKVGGTDTVITFDAQYFSNPVGFIGSDEDNLYIADDGVDFEYINENWHITANKNRIATLNRKTHDLTFKDAEATWYGDEKPYTRPDTPVLLWKNDGGNITYWTSADGTESFNATNKLFEYSSSPTIQKPTEAFCYDQDGNLYILWTDGSDYAVRRFELKDGTSYVTPGEYSPTLDSSLLRPSYIAVDISGGQNYLYCGYKDITNNWKVERMSWIGNVTTLTPPHSGWSITVGSAPGEELTALAANKDGVFVAVKETYQDSSILKYRLKVKKHQKGTGTQDSEITLVDGGICYKNAANTPLSGEPSSGDYKETIEAIHGLQVVEDVLYAATVKIEKEIVTGAYGSRTDVLKSSGKLYKVKETDAFSGSATELAKKDWNDVSETGYGFYRFIAVIPKKLVIASDGAWSTGGKAGLPPPPPSFPVIQKDTNKVLKYDLDGHLQNGEDGVTAGGAFSKELTIDGCGFSWK